MPHRVLPIALALTSILGASSGAQTDADRELRESLSRRMDEEVARFAGGFRRELGRDVPAGGLAAVLERLPYEELVHTVVGTRPPRLVGLADLALEIGDRRVVAVGEQHDDAAHHEIQARTLALLHRLDARVAVGMEMFQRPAQVHLDDFLAFRTSQAEFLERVDWAKSWGFDYGLYEEILSFARDHALPVVALNAPRDAIRSVSRAGLASLAPDVRATLAAEIDTSIASHRRRFEANMAGHPPHGNPDFIYEAMCAWDDTMAESAALFLTSNPGWRILVLAGNGHVESGDGIPDRIEKRLRVGHAIVVPRAVAPDEAIDFAALLADPPGDYVVFTRSGG